MRVLTNLVLTVAIVIICWGAAILFLNLGILPNEHSNSVGLTTAGVFQLFGLFWIIKLWRRPAPPPIDIRRRFADGPVDDAGQTEQVVQPERAPQQPKFDEDGFLAYLAQRDLTDKNLSPAQLAELRYAYQNGLG